MPTHHLEWRTNFRANLSLWPEIAPNIRTLAECHGQKYDEKEFLKRFPMGPKLIVPKTTRSVRNAFEAVSLAGLAYRTGGTQDKLYLTKLGQVLFKFLGVGAEKPLINERNRHLAADRLIAGLAVIVEYRTIWKLMRLTENRLTNDELNRAMAVIKTTDDVGRAAKLVLASRENGDLDVIGPNLYSGKDKLDQRKVLNPWFLRAGGGRLFTSLQNGDKFRRIEPFAEPMIDRWIKDEALPGMHASTDAKCAKAMSEHAGCL